MKMKKILSMGALGLVVACSTSIGALAAEQKVPSKAGVLIGALISQYDSGKNQTGLLTGVNKDTKIGSIVSSDFVKKVDSTFGNYKTVDKAITKFDNNQNETVAQILQKATKDEATFNKFKADFVNIAEKVQAMDKLQGKDREDAEVNVINIVKAYDSTLKVTFGKDSKGNTTGTITKLGKTIIELNYNDVQSIIDAVNGITWDYVVALKATH
ncbi:hypothetical protein ACUH7Y_05575 [Clostridium beijerinckii]|uniref:Lipoprotein n=1 Tax=Clostridium beijerinckii TaxID=1520 RepID=A0A7X9SN92_CLOBE|nr:hypothetical protein [Clostridium beijerinckii]NMF05004.1 hypothetical protein [Clostridium beijerinckii]